MVLEYLQSIIGNSFQVQPACELCPPCALHQPPSIISLHPPCSTMATNNPRKKKATPEPATLTWASARQQNKNPSGTALASTTAAAAAPLLSLLPLPPPLHTVATKVVSVYHYHRRRHCCHPLSSPLSPPLPLQTIQPMVLGNRRRRVVVASWFISIITMVFSFVSDYVES
jgi:hypothetical protein